MFPITRWKAALAEWRNRRISSPAADQLASLSLVADTDLRRDQVERLAEVYPEGIDQFDAMLVRVGIDTKAAPLKAAVRADLYLSCTECTRRSECMHWLASEVNDAAYREFCPNAQMFDLIGREQWHGATPDSTAAASAAHGPAIPNEMQLSDIIGSRRSIAGD